MNLSELTRSEIPDLLDSHDVEIRSKDDPIWYHAPLIWMQIAIVWFSRKSPTAFSLTLPKFLGGAAVYLSGDYDFEAIRRGEAPLSAMPLITHELTHALQIIALGMILFAIYYLTFPAPIFWTGRSTLEWEADANEIAYIRGAYYSVDLDSIIKSAADLFTGPTYVWPTLDRDGWIAATWDYIANGDGLDARQYSNEVCYQFSGFKVNTWRD